MALCVVLILFYIDLFRLPALASFVQVIDVVENPVLDHGKRPEALALLLECVLLCQVGQFKKLLIMPLLADFLHFAEAQVDRMLIDAGKNTTAFFRGPQVHMGRRRLNHEVV